MNIELSTMGVCYNNRTKEILAVPMRYLLSKNQSTFLESGQTIGLELISVVDSMEEAVKEAEAYGQLMEQLKKIPTPQAEEQEGEQSNGS